MKSDQYILSLNSLYRIYPKNLPKAKYDNLNDLIEHYSSKDKLNEKEAKDAEDACRNEWKKFILLFFHKIKKERKKYADILKEEEKELKKIENKIKINNMPFGGYEQEWDSLEAIYDKASSKINLEKRNFKRNWIGHLISFIIGIVVTLITTLMIRRYF